MGSSASSTGGSFASARAIATRCCCPPESAAGSLSACSAIADPGQQLAAPPGAAPAPGRSAAEVHRQHHVLRHRQRRQELEELEHDADGAAAPAGQGVRSPCWRSLAGDHHLAARPGTSIPASRLSSVDLPLPDGPTIATNSPAPMPQADVVESEAVAGFERVLLRDRVHPDRRVGRLGSVVIHENSSEHGVYSWSACPRRWCGQAPSGSRISRAVSVRFGARRPGMFTKSGEIS